MMLSEYLKPALGVVVAAALVGGWYWFEHRPLFGQRIVVTRTREQASQLSKQLSDLGAEVLEIPMGTVKSRISRGINQLQRQMTPAKLRNAINGNLDRDVRVLFAEVAPDDFHARYSAIGKTYVYRLVHGPIMSPFWAGYAHHEARAIDLERMRSCARLFIGEHDWTAYSAAQADGESRVRKITSLVVSAGWDGRGLTHLIEFSVSANGFLRYMVRSIVGTLLAAGRGEIEADIIARAIRERDRNLAGATAPACGLTLLRVQYD